MRTWKASDEIEIQVTAALPVHERKEKSMVDLDASVQTLVSTARLFIFGPCLDAYIPTRLAAKRMSLCLVSHFPYCSIP